MFLITKTVFSKNKNLVKVQNLQIPQMKILETFRGKQRCKN